MSNTKLVSGAGLILAICLFVAFNILANQTLTSLRLDVTENKLFTLSGGTLNILGSLEEPITLKYYFSNKLFAGFPEYQTYGVRVRDLLEEYAAKSRGRLKLTIIDPEPFSEAEDQAVGYGIRQLPVSSTGDMAYFGLVGANTTDDEMVLPFFQPSREQSLEYDLTKLIYSLAHPQKRVIGVISGLPVFGTANDAAAGQRGTPPWTLINYLKEVFQVRELRGNTAYIENDVDTLLVIHPKNLPEPTQYAIDQFVLKGGKAMVFVDPFSEGDESMPDPSTPQVMPSHSSDMPLLLQAWGLKLVPEKIVGDLGTALHVSAAAGARGPQEVAFLPWLGLEPANLNKDDFVTNQLKAINLGSAGALEPVEGASTTITPLLKSSTQAAFLEADQMMFARDPRVLLEGFKADGKEHILAARVNGKVKSAFPKGRPKEKPEGLELADKDFLAESKGPVNLIVVADTDLLADRFWVRTRDVMGVPVPAPIADNADFVINALDNLGGNDDLISLRSRGQYARPFEVVNKIQAEAERQFLDKEHALQSKLEETEKKLRALQQQKDASAKTLLSPEQTKAIEKFKEEQVTTRKELRNVQHELRKNIERLGNLLRFINIGLIPILIGLLAIVVTIARASGNAAARRSAAR